MDFIMPTQRQIDQAVQRAHTERSRAIREFFRSGPHFLVLAYRAPDAS